MTYALMAAICALFLAALYVLEWKRRDRYRRRLRLNERRNYERMSVRR